MATNLCGQQVNGQPGPVLMVGHPREQTLDRHHPLHAIPQQPIPDGRLPSSERSLANRSEVCPAT